MRKNNLNAEIVLIPQNVNENCWHSNVDQNYRGKLKKRASLYDVPKKYYVTSEEENEDEDQKMKMNNIFK